jgi:hypothetical protein
LFFILPNSSFLKNIFPFLSFCFRIFFSLGIIGHFFSRSTGRAQYKTI